MDSNAHTHHDFPVILVKTGRMPACMECACLPWSSHPLFDAASQGDHELVADMLKKDVQLVKTVVGSKHYTAWHVAAENGHVEVLKTLVHAVLNCQDAAHQLNSSLRRLLSIARTGERLARYFLNSRCRGGATPLILASRAGKVEAVAYLLSMGANPWMDDSNGLAALHVAAIHNQNEVIHELCRQDIPFSRRANSANSSSTKYVDICDPYGWTPLHHACLANQIEAMKTLMSHDANIVARTTQHNMKVDLLPTGLTALHIAAYKGSLPMAKALLRAYYESSADLLPSQTAMLATGERRRRQRAHPDPRLILTRTARLPYHFAHRLAHTHMLEWLDPTIPLMFLFAGSGSDDTAGQGDEIKIGVARLTVLAATALHQLLIKQLEDAEAKMAELAQGSSAEEDQAQAATMGGTMRNLLSTLNLTKPRGVSVTGTSSPRLGARDMDPAGPGTSGPSLVGTATGRAKRPRRLSNPLPARGDGSSGAGGSSKAAKERDVLDLGDKAGIMLRLRHNVRLARRGKPLQVCTRQDLLRMGIAIPNNVDNDPVAVFRHGADAAMLTTWHGGMGLAHAINIHGDSASGVERGSADGRTSVSQREVMQCLRSSEPGMSSGAATGEEGTPLLTSTGNFLTAEPPTPFKDELVEANHPFALSVDQKAGLATWPLISSTAVLPQADPTAAAHADAQGELIMSRISERTEHDQSAQSTQEKEASAAPESQSQPDKRTSAGGNGVVGTVRQALTKTNRVHPEVAQDGENVSHQPAVSSDNTDMQPKAPTAVDDDDDDDVCPVCLDEVPNIQLDRCKHRLCLGCARDLCQRHQLTPALCPYCRTVIPGLTLVAKAP